MTFRVEDERCCSSQLRSGCSGMQLRHSEGVSVRKVARLSRCCVLAITLKGEGSIIRREEDYLFRYVYIAFLSSYSNLGNLLFYTLSDHHNYHKFAGLYEIFCCQYSNKVCSWIQRLVFSHRGVRTAVSISHPAFYPQQPGCQW